MLRFLSLLAAVTACSVNDKPTLALSIDDQQNLSITLERGDDHTFGSVHATANGIDCGYAEIEKGSEGITFSEASSPATATWTIAMAQLGEAAHVVVSEDSDTFTIDLPTLGAPRSPQILTSLAGPIAPGDRIEVATGVASDLVTGTFEIDANGKYCTSQWDTQLTPGSASLGLATPDNLQYDWWCSATEYPAPGTLVKGTLKLEIDASVNPTTCSGDDLTCESVTVPPMNLDVPIQVQF